MTTLAGPIITDPEQFSTEEMRDLARTWPMFTDILLPDAATVIIAGAYQGKLMQFMLEAFPQIKRVIGFEPTTWAWQQAVHRLQELGVYDGPTDFRKARVYRYGLLADNGEVSHVLPMYEWETDAQSLIENTDHPDKPVGQGTFIGVKAGLDVAPSIDLFIMNMEGYEWVLLPYMFDNGLLGRIKSLAVQFHPHATYVAPAHDTMAIRHILADVYGKPVYEQYPQWTYWRRERA